MWQESERLDRVSAFVWQKERRQRLPEYTARDLKAFRGESRELRARERVCVTVYVRGLLLRVRLRLREIEPGIGRNLSPTFPHPCAGTELSAILDTASLFPVRTEEERELPLSRNRLALTVRHDRTSATEGAERHAAMRAAACAMPRQRLCYCLQLVQRTVTPTQSPAVHSLPFNRSPSKLRLTEQEGSFFVRN